MSEEINSETWLAMVVNLPASNPALRMRVWRAMKALGSAALRDGVYLLPAGLGLRQTLRLHVEEIRQGGGIAYLLDVANPAAEEKTDFKELFNRSEEYRDLMSRIGNFLTGFVAHDANSGRRQLKLLRRDLETLGMLDYFPGANKIQAETLLAEAEAAFIVHLSPGEPLAIQGRIIQQNRAEYRNRLWATRRHLWVDRLASAWLIRRFIDPEAHFLWLEKPEDCPPEAIGFDFDGATFSHVAQRVSFEVLLASFSLESDLALAKMGTLVHYLDIGGSVVAEAAGVEMVLTGAKQRCAGDDALLAEASAVFDSLYSAFTV